jgi:hypothetical protein
MKKRLMSVLLIVTLVMAFFGAALPAAGAAAVVECGDPTVVTLFAGQTMNAGNVTVANDDSYIYVTFAALGDWLLKETHLAIASTVAGIPQTKNGSPVPGQFPYKMTHNPLVNTYTYVIAKADLPEGGSYAIAAHAVVVKVDATGAVIASETGWGDGTRFVTKGNWATWFGYTWQECDDENTIECWTGTDETAWAAGSRYVDQGSWATYTTYEGVAKSVTLLAGQAIGAGTVTFSAPDNGLVTITIALNDSATFRMVAANIKIQDYATAPSGNPAIGGFAHKATVTDQTQKSVSIVVPQNSFYGVHVDVSIGAWGDCVE